jgi:hypothetical protein
MLSEILLTLFVSLNGFSTFRKSGAKVNKVDKEDFAPLFLKVDVDMDKNCFLKQFK